MLIALKPSRSLMLALTVSFAVLNNASGHSNSLDSNPMPGAVLTTPPDTLSVNFDAPMRIISVRLTDAAGERFNVSAKAGRASSQSLTVTPPSLANGRYVLEWRGLSDDGHTLSDQLEFVVAID